MRDQTMIKSRAALNSNQFNEDSAYNSEEEDSLMHAKKY